MDRAVDKKNVTNVALDTVLFLAGLEEQSR